MRPIILLLISAILLPAGETWTVTPLAANGSKTCRRPMAVGFYDETAKQTFVCWSGPDMRAQLAAYDHGTKKWQAFDKKVTYKHPDQHDYPHMVQSRDGKIHLFWSKHNHALYQATAAKPHDVAGDWSQREIGKNLKATYPMPVVTADGAILVFYRITLGKDYRPMAWVRSDDEGKTWSDPVRCIDYGKTRRDDHLDEIYVGALTPAVHPRDGAGFHVSWTIAGGGPTRHDHDDYHKDMYHAFFRSKDGQWLAADGAVLGANIDDDLAVKRCRVFDSGELVGIKHKKEPMDIGYISKVQPDAAGQPVVAFVDGKKKSIAIGRFVDGTWVVAHPEGLAGTMGFQDLQALATPGHLRLYNGYEGGIRVFESRDGGVTWSATGAFTADRKIGLCTVIDSARDEVCLLLQYRGKGYRGEYPVWVAGQR